MFIGRPIQQFLISSKQKIMIDQSMVTTNIELNGYRVIKNLGVVRGITVRSRSILGNIAGGLQTLFGGTISIYVELCEKTRAEAFRLMLQSADERGANGRCVVRSIRPRRPIRDVRDPPHVPRVEVGERAILGGHRRR